MPTPVVLIPFSMEPDVLISLVRFLAAPQCDLALTHRAHRGDRNREARAVGLAVASALVALFLMAPANHVSAARAFAAPAPAAAGVKGACVACGTVLGAISSAIDDDPATASAEPDAAPVTRVAARTVTRADRIEMVLRMDDGSVRHVTQPASGSFKPGQRVRVSAGDVIQAL
jgi:hypothetical protein